MVASNAKNSFATPFDGREVAGKTFYFSLISLFPETFKGRPNDFRKDLAETVHGLRPRFLRFPGANNLKGISLASRYQWQNAVGPLIHRPDRPGTWNYYNTDGFDLLEYLQWTEDMEMEIILDKYAGYALDLSAAEKVGVGLDTLPEILASALDEITYCMGFFNRTYGALRAEHVHSQPFNDNYVEIGNEDGFPGIYSRRLLCLYDGIKAAYPEICQFEL